MYVIDVRSESKRGCGFRKPGGLYLVSGGLMAPCGLLPIPLTVCPTCGSGVKPSRGWTWLNVPPLVADRTCADKVGGDGCFGCPMRQIGRAGLLWVGESFYRTPAAFMREAAEMGVSRRIKSVPRGFTVGETWVLLAHRKVIVNADESWTAAIFHAFRPTAIEYVVRQDDSEQKLQRLDDRGIKLVRVRKAGETGLLPVAAGGDGLGVDQ